MSIEATDSYVGMNHELLFKQKFAIAINLKEENIYASGKEFNLVSYGPVPYFLDMFHAILVCDLGPTFYRFKFGLRGEGKWPDAPPFTCSQVKIYLFVNCFRTSCPHAHWTAHTCKLCS